MLSRVFRGKFVRALRRAFRQKKLRFTGSASELAAPQQFAAFLHRLFRQDWVVYAKPAFGGPEAVLRYLGRYTHREAISNHRLLSFDGERVAFRWKDYARGNKQRVMTLSATEFLRRFAQHILPRGFVRIRQFGFLANGCRSALLTLSRSLIGFTSKPRAPCEANVAAVWQCPRCRAPMLLGPKLTPGQLVRRCIFLDSS